MAASEIVHGLHLKKKNYKNKHGDSTLELKNKKKKRIGEGALFVVRIILCGPVMDLKRCL